MNIQMQCCGLVILLVLLFFSMSQKKVGLYTEKLFLLILIIASVSIMLDISSIMVIIYLKELPEILVAFICKTYVVSVVWVGCSAFVYVLTDILSEKKFYSGLKYVGICLLIESAIIYILPISYYNERGESFTRGPAILATYLFAVSYILATFFCMFYFRNRVTSRRRIAVLIWMGLWMTAAIIQFLNNQYLLVGFASALGMMVVFFILENPEANIDRTLGCFHAHAMASYLKQSFERGENFGILLISMSAYQKSSSSSENIDSAIRSLVQFLDERKDVKVFKDLEQELVLIFPDMSHMAVVFQEIQDEFYRDQFYEVPEKKCLFPKTLFVLVPESRIFRNMEEVIQLFQHIKLEERDRQHTYVCYVNEMNLEEMRAREKTEDEIVRALEEDRVEVFFQPIYSTKEKQIISAEALARIRNEDGSIMPPGKFIPVAEESGLISRLGERVFEKVCRFLKESEALSLGVRYVEVNLSVAQFEQRDLADRYIRIMEKYRIEPWWINLEITETASVQTKNTLLANMERLINYGVSFSLDDFGNGQSNLDYVIDMPVSIMKLDMNMTRAYFKDLKAQFVVQATIRMAHDMDLMMVAEGVETREQLEVMSDEKIDYIQGYLFSKPLPINEFIEYLRKYKNGFVDK